MSASHDFDRIARAWLDLMPDQAPERVLDSVLQAVEVTPQARRPLRWPSRRSTPMNRLPLATAATIVVAVAATLFLSRPGATGPGASTPSPASSLAAAGSTNPNPSGAASPPGSQHASVPEALLHRWMGGTTSLVAADSGSTLDFGPTDVSIAQANTNNRPVIKGLVAASAPDQLRITTAGTLGRCTDSQVGTYTWSLSASGRVLSIYGADDSCSKRESAIRGNWWLMGCKDPTDDCLGPLDAGTYQSQFINPVAAQADPWKPLFGALTYTVPDGWANDADWPTVLGISPASAYATWAPDQGVSSGITVLAKVQAESQATPCSGKPDDSVGSTRSAILAWLRTIKGLTIGQATPITIGGLPGTSLDLTTVAAAIRPCGSDDVVEYLIGSGAPLAIGAGERQRLLLLDTHSGVLAIQIADRDPTTFDAFATSAMPIVQSMTFR